MDTIALLVSRLQFTCTIAYHIIFPAFTIAIAASLTLLEAFYVATGRPVYRVLFHATPMVQQIRNALKQESAASNTGCRRGGVA